MTQSMSPSGATSLNNRTVKRDFLQLDQDAVGQSVGRPLELLQMDIALPLCSDSPSDCSSVW